LLLLLLPSSCRRLVAVSLSFWLNMDRSLFDIGDGTFTCTKPDKHGTVK
jgi:hypothetical protein